MITMGIIRENQVLSGEIKNLTPGMIIKGNVFLGSSDKGYYVYTNKDYYLSSDFYPTVEEIPSNIIDIMDSLYIQHIQSKQRSEIDVY